MKANNYALKDWHLEHVEKVVVRYIKGVSPDASSFEKRNYKKYSTVASCAKQIEYDVKHGVTHDEVAAVVRKVRHDKQYRELQKNADAIQRLDELERQLAAPRKVVASFF